MTEKTAPELTRRDFLKSSGAVAALASVGLTVGPTAAAQEQPAASPAPASERIVMGFIGVAGRGSGLMNEFMRHPDVEVGAICDVYKPRLDAAVAKSGGKARAYHDFRDLLAQKDIDAVVIATPPHWHPLISIYACQAGKDVYCEKPISNYPAEAHAMLKAARENKRVTQVGTQVHASDNFRRAVGIVKSGVLGKIMTVRVLVTMNEYPGGCGRPADSDPPEGLDWDMWLGPAPAVPFNKARFETHRYFKDYAMSWLHELGPHIVDLAHWAMDAGEPTAVSASGGRYVADDISDIPDAMDVIWEYPGFQMTWMHTSCNSFNFGFGGPPDLGRRLGVIFHGTNGTLMADYGSRKVVSEGDRLKDFVEPEPIIPASPGHVRDFLDCIKSRKQPSCSFEYHAPLAVALNLGHVALSAGRKIRWDAEQGRVIGDREADRLAWPSYRKPWKLPGVRGGLEGESIWTAGVS